MMCCVGFLRLFRVSTSHDVLCWLPEIVPCERLSHHVLCWLPESVPCERLSHHVLCWLPECSM